MTKTNTGAPKHVGTWRLSQQYLVDRFIQSNGADYVHQFFDAEVKAMSCMDLEGKKTSWFFDNFKEKRSLCGGLRVKEPRKASKIRAKRKSSKDGSRTNNK